MARRDLNKVDPRVNGLRAGWEALAPVANDPPATPLSDEDRAECRIWRSKIMALIDTIGAQLEDKP